MSIDMNVKVGVSGRYRIKVSDEHGNVKREVGPFDNLITDYFLDEMLDNAGGAANPIYWKAGVGTGTTPPQNSDVSLEAPLESVSNWKRYTNMSTSWGAEDRPGEEPLYNSKILEYRWDLGEIEEDLTEVGVTFFGSTTPDTSVCSRALITDETGTPIVLSVGATDQLTMYYEFRINVIPLGEFSAGTFDIDGTQTDFDYMGEWRQYTGTGSAYSVWDPESSIYGRLRTDFHMMYAHTSTDFVDPDGSISLSLPSEHVTPTGYVRGSFTQYYDMFFDTNDSIDDQDIYLVAVHIAYRTSSTGGWQLRFTPPINKSSVQKFSVRWSISLSRIAP